MILVDDIVEAPARLQRLPDEPELPFDVENHVVLAGYGRVGRAIAARLVERGIPYVVIEQNREALRDLEGTSVPFVSGDATNETVFARARPERARAC